MLLRRLTGLTLATAACQGVVLTGMKICKARHTTTALLLRLAGSSLSDRAFSVWILTAQVANLCATEPVL